MNKPLPLVVQDLSFRYRNRPEWAIRQVSFSLEPGKVLLVAGASPCLRFPLLTRPPSRRILTAAT